MSSQKSHEDGLNEAILEDVGQEFEKSLIKILKKYAGTDPGLELITVFLSFASQISQEMEMSEGQLIHLTKQMYQESATELVEPKTYTQFLGSTLKKPYFKPN